MSQPALEHDLWVQCDKCSKWRRLAPGTSIDDDSKWCGAPALVASDIESAVLHADTRMALVRPAPHCASLCCACTPASATTRRARSAAEACHRGTGVMHPQCEHAYARHRAQHHANVVHKRTQLLQLLVCRFCWNHPDPDQKSCDAPEEARRSHLTRPLLTPYTSTAHTLHCNLVILSA